MNHDNFNIENHKLLKYTGSETEVFIPEGVETIGTGAFEHCETMEYLIIPESVTHIEELAFHYCTALKRVNIFNTEMNMLGYYLPFLRAFCERDLVMEFGADNFMRICINGEVVPYEKIMLHNQEFVYRLLMERPKSENFMRMLRNDAPAYLYYLIEPVRQSDSARRDNLSKEAVFQVMLEEEIFTESNIDECIHWMIQLKAFEYQNMLIDYKYKHFEFKNPADNLTL